MHSDIIYEVESVKDIESLIKAFPSHCETNRFSLLRSYDYFDILESKGFPIDKKVYVFEICQARAASKVLATHTHFAPFMPCRVAIYQHNGKSIISTPNMRFMIDSVKDIPELHEMTATLYLQILELIDTLK